MALCFFMVQRHSNKLSVFLTFSFSIQNSILLKRSFSDENETQNKISYPINPSSFFEDIFESNSFRKDDKIFVGLEKYFFFFFF